MRFGEGQLIDRYQVVAALGQGAFSETYEARDERSGALVVLKVPHPAILGDPATFDRFRREMSIAHRIDHPGIQRSLDEGDARSVPYMVFEYVEGVDLRRYLREHGPLPVEQLVDFGLQLLAVLGYVHAQGVVHRDLKPENVLVTPAGRLKVADFGIALAAGARRLTWRHLTEGLGTPSYMAPEVVQGQRGDARTDLYSLGILLYELATGKPPYRADHYLAVMGQHLGALPERPRKLRPDLPPAIEGIILRLIRKRPEERYGSAAEAAADLARWRDLDPATVDPGEDRPLTATVTAGTSAGVWRLAAVIAGAFLLIAAVIVLVTVVLR
jgi:serine/threonine-protein kinase